MTSDGQYERERELFEEALERPTGDERQRFLEEACGVDTALLARLQGLLQAHEQSEAFLPQLAPPQESQAAVVPSEAPGMVLGRYKLLQKIGEGGCGTVYMAEQEKPVRRRVALKVIKLGMDTKSVIARFEAERQALALMDHPNIAKVLDAGATDTGRPYFVMELVRGVRITDYCDENRLSMHERLELFIQVCRAIQHAHQKGIIHRDIKPSNILVTVNDGVPVPKVIDFGIAKATSGQQLTDKTLFTAFEQFMGTPAYMSPEQAVMTSLDIDTRSDLYSLGVLLYELLTGKTPFDPKELLEVGFDEMRRTIREKEPARPSTRLSTMLEGELTATAKHRHTEPPRLANLIRGDLDWIVMKCLEKDRNRRYETANGLAADLQRHLSNEPVTARPPSNLYRFQKMVSRNKVAVATVAVVALVMVLGIVGSSWLAMRAKRAEREQTRLRQQAEDAEKTAHSESAKSQQVAQFLKDMLASVGPSVALGRDTHMLREILDQTSARLDKSLKDQPAVEADLRATLGNIYYDLGEFTNAAVMCQKSFELRKSLHGLEHPETAGSLNDWGESLRRLGKSDEAEPMIRQALELRRKLLGSNNLDVARSLDSLGFLISWRKGKWSEAEKLFRESLAIRRELLGNESLEVASSLQNLGAFLQDAGRSAEAENVQREALRIRSKILGSEHPDVAASLHHLAWSLLNNNKPAEAESKFREALAMRKKLLVNAHPDIAATLINLGSTLVREKKLTEAESVFREALEVYGRVFGPDHPSAAGVLSSLADTLRAGGKFPESESLYRRALLIKTESYGYWHPPAHSLHCRLGMVLLEEGKFDEAVAMLRQAAEEGSQLAKLQLGRMYASGNGVPKDESEAERWLRKLTESNDAQSLNLTAWKLATSEDEKQRGGKWAVALAGRAVELTQRKSPTILDTLAAAFAEAGEFDAAIRTQKEAISLLTDDSEVSDYKSRLLLYEAHTACRTNE